MDYEDALKDIKPGESVVYHEGINLDRCKKLQELARQLYEEKKLTLVRKRIELPKFEGQVDWFKGIGKFQYIAMGLGVRR